MKRKKTKGKKRRKEKKKQEIDQEVGTNVPATGLDLSQEWIC